MKKLFFTIAILTTMLFANFQTLYAMDFVELPKGSQILVHCKKMLTTATLQEGDEVYFVSPADVWVKETKIIPKNAIFVGYVDMLKMPIKAVNAAFSVKITKLVLPNGEIRNISGKIHTGRSFAIGGELTPPVSYNKMSHPYLLRWKWSGTTQWVPSGDYEFGRHSSVSPKENLFVVLSEPYLSLERP